MGNDLLRRSLAKTVSFRLIGSAANFVFAWIMTNDVSFATSLVLFQWIVITALYFAHERVWDLIDWGRKDG